MYNVFTTGDGTVPTQVTPPPVGSVVNVPVVGSKSPPVGAEVGAVAESAYTSTPNDPCGP